MDFETVKSKLLAEMSKSGFINNLDLEFTQMDENVVIGRIPFATKFLNPYGTMHGGLLYALADTVAGSLACLCGRMCTTVDGHLTYLRPAADTEYVYCKATLVRSGMHLAYVRVEIYGDDGTLYDDGDFNYYKLAD